MLQWYQFFTPKFAITKTNKRMPITTERKKYFRSLGHKLKPVVTIAGKGLTENVLAELDRALEDHELLKVKVAVADRELRTAVIEEMCKTCRAENVQEIGKIALIYRAAKKPNGKKSNII